MNSMDLSSEFFYHPTTRHILWDVHYWIIKWSIQFGPTLKVHYFLKIYLGFAKDV